MKPLNLLVPGKASVIIDGQFGSTGKGLIAAYVGLTERVDVAITNAAPNAGHTAIIPISVLNSEHPVGEVLTYTDGHAWGSKYVTYHLPMSGVLQPDSLIYLNAGSIIDPPALIEECKHLNVDVSRVLIHPRAAILRPEHKEYEQWVGSTQTKTGSTRKGVGRALAMKVMREGEVAIDLAHDELFAFKIGRVEEYKGHDWMRDKNVLIEMPQGFDLSLNHGLSFPHCTSRDITVSAALADCGLHPSDLGKTLMTVRTYPIRVGHIYGEDGTKIGDSGPCWSDQEEVTWESLGLEPELTTVTKRPRRIFTFSADQFARAVRINKPDIIFANFMNMFKTDSAADLFAHRLRDWGEYNLVYGTGPKVTDVHSSMSSMMKYWGP